MANTKIKELHTGQLVAQVLKQKRVTHAALARATHRSQSNLSTLIKGPSTQAYILWQMSLALKHNLFRDMADQLDAATNGRMAQGAITIETLQKEVEQLRKERDTLMKAIAKLSG